MKAILGIDPGLDGALALISEEASIVHDMPTLNIEKNGKARRKLNGNLLLQILKETGATHAVIEAVNAQPGNGITAAYTYGWGCGMIEMAVIAAGIPYSYVYPQTWKAAHSCPRDKDGARLRASQLLPGMAHYWPLKKHDGRAEAALISLYGWERIA